MNKINSNFQLLSQFKSRDFQTIASTFSIDKATYVHFANSNRNNHAAILFKIPFLNDSGIFHVIQNILCSGSQRFPVRDAWSHMPGRSLQPQNMNPYIMPEYMVFEIASPIREDFENLLDMTFEQIFSPLFREVDFLQQVRMQLSGDELIMRGNVFEQMRDQYHQPEVIHMEGVRKAMLRGYSSTGGNPLEMVDLNFEKCLEIYQKYITFENAYFVTAGNANLDQNLKLIERLMGKYEKRKGVKAIQDLQFTNQQRVSLKGVESYSFAFQGPSIQHQDYLKMQMLSFLLHEVENFGLRGLLDVYEQYTFNYGCDTLSKMIFQIGFKSKSSEDSLYSFMEQLRNDFYSVIPQKTVDIALDRMKLRRELILSDIYQYIIHDVAMENYLNQDIKSQDFGELIKKYFQDNNKCNVIMEDNQEEYIDEQLKKKLKDFKYDPSYLGRVKQIIDEDTSVLSLESLPKLSKLPNIENNNKQQIIKYPQQCNIEWIIDINDLSQEDIESVYLLKDLLPQIFNKKEQSEDLECRIIDNQQFIIELSCLDKNINNIFSIMQQIIDPPLDDLELLSQFITIQSSILLNEDIHNIAISVSQQNNITLLNLARLYGKLEVEILRNYNSKPLLQQFSNRIISIFYKLMNNHKQQYNIFVNPLLKQEVQAQIDLLNTNLNIQFEDFYMNRLEFNQKYQIQPEQPSQFKYLKTFISTNSATNSVAETIQVPNQMEYSVLAALLTNLYLPQYCTLQQKAYCIHQNDRLTFYTREDVNTVKSYRLFENALHLFLDCFDQETLLQGQILLYSEGKDGSQVTQEQVVEAGKSILKKMADGETAQVIVGQIPNAEGLLRRGWVVERYVNETAV